MLNIATGFQLYDTTLRDGMQQEGMSLSVSDKLAVARLLDKLGVGFIEGGWPGAIPKDTAFFRRAQTELTLRNARLAAFGATRRPDLAVGKDPQVRALLDAHTPVVTLVAKSDTRHVERALRTTKTENLAMLRDTVRHLIREGRRVMVDAEHFFDGFHHDRAYALAFVDVAMDAGAEVVVLCDTNGGTLPSDIGDCVVTAGRAGARLGIHCHDDAGCAVANSLTAVAAGVAQVQATAHGYGERCGNANLFTLVANLALKNDPPLVAPGSLAQLVELATAISDVTTAPPDNRAPYVGRAAFTHKAGLHASAIRVDPSLYQHVEPALLGNRMRTLVSDQAGRASIELKARELGYDVSAGSELGARIARRVKDLEEIGYAFEAADASFELLVRQEIGDDRVGAPFDADSWSLSVVPLPDGGARHEVSATFRVNGETSKACEHAATEQLAMERAIRAGLSRYFPAVRGLEVVRCQVWDLDGSFGRPAATRVLLTFADGPSRWSTVGVAEGRAVACWRALCEAARYLALRERDDVSLAADGLLAARAA